MNLVFTCSDNKIVSELICNNLIREENDLKDCPLYLKMDILKHCLEKYLKLDCNKASEVVARSFRHNYKEMGLQKCPFLVVQPLLSLQNYQRSHKIEITTLSKFQAMNDVEFKDLLRWIGSHGELFSFIEKQLMNIRQNALKTQTNNHLKEQKKQLKKSIQELRSQQEIDEPEVRKKMEEEKKLEREISEIKKKNEELEETTKLSLIKIEEAKSLYNTYKICVSNKKDKLNCLKSDIVSDQTSHSKVQKEINDLQGEKDSYLKEQAKYQNELENMKKEILKDSELYKVSQEVISHLRKIKEEENKRISIKSEFDNLNSNYQQKVSKSSLEDDLSKLKNNIQNLTSHLDKLHNDQVKNKKKAAGDIEFFKVKNNLKEDAKSTLINRIQKTRNCISQIRQKIRNDEENCEKQMKVFQESIQLKEKDFNNYLQKTAEMYSLEWELSKE